MPSSYNVHLVVPTNRPERMNAFFTAWAEKDVWRKIHVVYDNPLPVPLSKLTDSYNARGTEVATYGWEQIDALSTPARHIFSRRDSACRCFGFMKAYQDGADYIVTLDDDCVPHGGESPFEFMYSHLTAFSGTPRWASTVPGYHVRGLPYANKGTAAVDLNVGLWSNVADLSAPEQLVRTDRGETLNIPLPSGRRVMPTGQFSPMCGMNLAFTRRAVPLMYFPLMGECQPFSRFDDIWCGILAQKVMAHLGWNWTCGEPFVRHDRASDPVTNLAKEAPGIKVNEKLWEAVDGLTFKAGTPLDAMREAGSQLNALSDLYLQRWGLSLQRWCDLL